MAITTLDQVVAGFQPQLSFLKSSVSSLTAGLMHSLWNVAGRPAAAGAPAGPNGTALVNTSATLGAMAFTNPTGGRLSYLGRLGATGTQLGTLIVLDRLVECSFDGNSSGSQSLTGMAVTRPTSGYGEMFLECTAAPGVTSRTLNVTYTNSVGTGGKGTSVATVASGSGGVANTLIPILPASGDLGARSIQSVQLSASASTGNFCMLIARRLAMIPLWSANVAEVHDAIALGMPRIEDSACLMLAFLPGSTTSGTIQGELSVTQG